MISTYVPKRRQCKQREPKTISSWSFPCWITVTKRKHCYNQTKCSLKYRKFVKREAKCLRNIDEDDQIIDFQLTDLRVESSVLQMAIPSQNQSTFIARFLNDKGSNLMINITFSVQAYICPIYSVLRFSFTLSIFGHLLSLSPNVFLFLSSLFHLLIVSLCENCSWFEFLFIFSQILNCTCFWNKLQWFKYACYNTISNGIKPVSWRLHCNWQLICEKVKKSILKV